MYNIILPKKLNEAIKDLKLTNTQRNHAYEFFRMLLAYNLLNSNDYSMNSFISIPSGYLREVFTWQYNSMFMDVLHVNGIIIKRPYYNSNCTSKFKGNHPENNRPYGYRISDDFFDFSDFACIPSKNKKLTSRINQLEMVINDLNLLEIDINGMIEYAKSYSIDNFIQVNGEITDETIEIVDTKVKDKNGNPRPYTKKLEEGLKIAKERNVDLILYRDNCYLEKVEDFMRIRLNNFKAAQLYTINSLLNKDYYASRNSTNNRLDTNLTNLKSDFIKKGYIKFQGENLVDIDLNNSQPCLLAFLLSDIDRMLEVFPSLSFCYKYPSFDSTSQDLALFIDLAGQGMVYDHICYQTGWSRPLAKNIFIRTMFSKAGWRSAYKKKLQELFPSVINWMDEFKQLNEDHTQLAIMLQKIEAEIFISDIYYALKKDGYVIFTKHDSILCKASQKAEIQLKMEEILNQYGFKYKLK